MAGFVTREASHKGNDRNQWKLASSWSRWCRIRDNFVSLQKIHVETIFFNTHSKETFQSNCYLKKLHLNSVCIDYEVKVGMSVSDTVESYACFMYALYKKKLYFEKNYKAHMNGTFSSGAAMCLKLGVLT